jgi:hypothetical protein
MSIGASYCACEDVAKMQQCALVGAKVGKRYDEGSTQSGGLCRRFKNWAQEVEQEIRREGYGKSITEAGRTLVQNEKELLCQISDESDEDDSDDATRDAA